MKDQESDLLDTVMQRFQVVESSIATLAHSVHEQKVEHADYRRSLDTPRTESVHPSQMPSWFESVPDRLASLEASVAAVSSSEKPRRREQERKLGSLEARVSLLPGRFEVMEASLQALSQAVEQQKVDHVSDRLQTIESALISRIDDECGSGARGLFQPQDPDPETVSARP